MRLARPGWACQGQARARLGLCGWLGRAGPARGLRCTNSVRLDMRPVAGFGGLVATWVAGALLSGLLGLFPGLGGPLARAWRAGVAYPGAE